MIFVNNIKNLVILFVMISSVCFASINDSPARNIRETLHYTATKGEMLSPEQRYLINNLNRVMPTPGDSQTGIVLDLAEALIEQITSPEASPEEQNYQIYQSFTSPDKSTKRKAIVLNNAAQRLSDEDRNAFSAVRILHLEKGEFRTDRHTRQRRYSGGHSFKDYALGSLATPCFIGQDDRFLGVLVNDPVSAVKHAKTVWVDFAPGAVLYSLRSRQKIARDGLYEVSYTADEEFLSGFIDVSNPLKVDTLFPLLVVKGNLRDEDGKVLLGSFGDLPVDYDTVYTYEDINNRQDIRISPAEYNDMVRRGTYLITAPGQTVMVDITRPFQRRFGADLRRRGFYNGWFPGKLYAYGMA